MIFIQRTLYFQLKDHLEKEEISVIIGPRQAGKTTVMKKLQNELERKNKSCIFFNLDVVEDRHFFKTQHTLLELIKQKIGLKKAYVFIDEISRLKNAGSFLKGLYDLKTPYKFIVSGSGALELRTDIIEPLTGRKKTFYCLPLSFTEFTAFKYKIHVNSLNQLFEEVIKKLAINPYENERLIKEYLTFGGYPKVVLTETEGGKLDILRENYLSYLEKDIKLILKVEKEQAFENLVSILATEVGNILNRAKLASILGITEKTINKYLYLLEKTFVIKKVKPYYRNSRKELIKSPKIYFFDLGFLHMAQGIIPSIKKTIKGNIFENACFLRLLELDLMKSPLYWRTKAGAEVDFVIFCPKTGKPVAIEVKLTAKRTFGKSLISFIDKYQPEKAYIYFLNQGKDKNYVSKSVKTKIEYLPYYYLPLKKTT